MSDTPLFQSADEQERSYAPEQLPAGATAKQAADTEESARNDTGAGVGVMPTTGVVFEGNNAGLGSSSGTAGTTGGVAPVVGAAALAQQSEENKGTGGSTS